MMKKNDKHVAEEVVFSGEKRLDTEGTERKLESRHIQMIAIGGTIGTGLLVTSGETLGSSGALGALISYVVAGIAIFFVVNSLGEMATLIPITGSFNTYAARFLDPALGFACGWIYWLGWVTTLPIELMACGGFLNYWMPNVDKYILMLVVLIVLVLINSFAVGGFGEMEYWLSLTKIIAIVGFIGVTTYVLIKENKGTAAWDAAGGPFLGESAGGALMNVINGMIACSFAFSGTELVGITAGEAKNPRKSIPRAINGTFWRILFFYISCICLIGFLLPANLPEFNSEDDMVKSPFVISLSRAGIPYVDHIMNFVCLVAVFSAANSTVYASARCLMALAQEGQAPRFLAKTKNGVPFFAMSVSVSFGTIAFLGKLDFMAEGDVFNRLVDITGLGLIITWLMINITHIRFRAAYVAQGFEIKDLPYQALFYPYGCYFGILVMGATLVLSPVFALTGSDGLVGFFVNFIVIPIFGLLFVGWKYTKKTKFRSLQDVDLTSDNINMSRRSSQETGQDDEGFSDNKKSSKWRKFVPCLN